MKIAVITLSDRAARGEYKDLSGPKISEIFHEALPSCELFYELIPDSQRALLGVLRRFSGCNWIFTTGGTGLSKRDITARVTRKVCSKMIPGISEMLRARSLEQTPFASLSCAEAGVIKRGKAIIVNFPGSLKGATFCAQQMLPLLQHGPAMLSGEGHAHASHSDSK